MRARLNSQEIFRRCVDGALSLIIDHAGATALHMAHVTLQRIVHRNAGTSTRLAVVGSEACCLFDRTARDFPPRCLDDDMGTRHPTRMQPDIVGCSLVERYFLILATILANQQCKAVTALHT